MRVAKSDGSDLADTGVPFLVQGTGRIEPSNRDRPILILHPHQTLGVTIRVEPELVPRERAVHLSRRSGNFVLMIRSPEPVYPTNSQFAICATEADSRRCPLTWNVSS
jgi:hypothetical protein